MARRISILLIALLLITGCNSESGNISEPTPTNEPAVDNGNDNNVSEQPSGKTETPAELEANLNDFVLQDTGLTLQYHGLAEYGHNETLAEVQPADNGRIYVFHGVMNDGTGRMDENGDPLSFQREMLVTDESITSRIESEHDVDIRTSLFREKILLQKPLKVNHSWTEPIDYQGKTYHAVSTITNINENEDGHKVITVETIVDNMDGYPENPYKERITLEEGKGLISFENNDIGYSPPLNEEGYTFGYGLSIIQ